MHHRDAVSAREKPALELRHVDTSAERGRVTRFAREDVADLQPVGECLPRLGAHLEVVVDVAGDEVLEVATLVEPVVDEQGQYSGMVADYVALLSKRLGVRFEPQMGLNWRESYARGLRRLTARLGVEVGWAERRPRFSISYYEHPYRPRSWQNEYEVYYAGSAFRFEGADAGRAWTRNRLGAEV